MLRKIVVTSFALAVVFGSVSKSQAQLAVSAAATEPVPGWQRMELSGDGPLWVSPTPALTSDDIEAAEAQTRADGSTVVAVQFTESGSEKISALSEGQIGRPVALLLDGELISAPVVRTMIGSRAEISGGPDGLTPSEVERILASVED